jgi:hypothetical protein
MFATFLSQVIADGESSLATADDNRIDFVQHGRLLDYVPKVSTTFPICLRNQETTLERRCCVRMYGFGPNFAEFCTMGDVA